MAKLCFANALSLRIRCGAHTDRAPYSRGGGFAIGGWVEWGWEFVLRTSLGGRGRGLLLRELVDASVFSLPPFRFDAAIDTLWHGARARRLRPRAAAVLHYLLRRPGEIVTADEILAALWPDVQVGAGVVKVYVWEIRQALRDRQDKPRFVETVPKRGYRWIAASSTVPREVRVGAGSPRAVLVGRDAELALLTERLARAEQGERQTVFVTGEPGIGKTALIAALVRMTEDRPQVAVATGQCIEHSGPGEAYLPVLTALEQIGRASCRERVFVGV